MKHPSIRLRLMVGTGLIVTATLLAANFLIYGSIRRALLEEVDRQLLQSASLLAKSAELEADSLDYEWQEALKSADSSEIDGVFCFWDLSSGRVTKSPELGDRELPLFHGDLNRPRLGDFVFKDGRHARIVGLLHLPFTDRESIELAATMGKTLRVEDYPQVVVCARETDSLAERLSLLRSLLIRSTIATLLAISAAIFAIVTWCLRPIREFGTKLLERSESEQPGESVIPEALPAELVGLARTFNTALAKVESSREREKEFALHAAHELRTPVAGAYATLEQAIARDRPAADLKSRIHEALGILTGIRVTLGSLMRLARLRGGLENSTKESFDPIPVVRELTDLSAPLAARRGQAMTLHAPASIPPINTDIGLFRAAVSNLLENSVRHSSGSGPIRIGLGQEHGKLLFTCSNSVDGHIEPSVIGKWFQPFQRGSDAADDEGGHAGLGLSLSNAAVKLLGGELTASMIGPAEIQFKITLPY